MGEICFVLTNLFQLPVIEKKSLWIQPILKNFPQTILMVGGQKRSTHLKVPSIPVLVLPAHDNQLRKQIAIFQILEKG